jgi:hypothetical protein
VKTRLGQELLRRVRKDIPCEPVKMGEMTVSRGPPTVEISCQEDKATVVSERVGMRRWSWPEWSVKTGKQTHSSAFKGPAARADSNCGHGLLPQAFIVHFLYKFA